MQYYLKGKWSLRSVSFKFSIAFPLGRKLGVSTFDWESTDEGPVLTLTSNIWYSPGFFLLWSLPLLSPLYNFFFLKGFCPVFIIMLVSLFFFKNKFIYFWLRWVFVAARGLSLVAASGGYSSLWCTGFSLRWLLLLWSTGSRCVGFSSCGLWALERRLSSCGARA